MNYPQKGSRDLFKIKSSNISGKESHEIINQIEKLTIRDDSSYISNTGLIAEQTEIGSKTIEEWLFDACANVKIVASQVSMHIDPETKANLIYQIDKIHDPIEWDEEDKPLLVGSFRSFLKWLILNKPDKGAGLGISSKGNLVAVWMHRSDRLILEFYLGDRAKWIVDKKDISGGEFASGSTNITRLREVLDPYNVDEVFFSKDA